MRVLDPSTLPSLIRLIGSDRLAPYLSKQGGDSAQAMRLYSWNVEVSAAILGAYAALEVGVRNAMHDRLCYLFGRAEWWAKAPLSANDRDQIREVEEHLDRRKGPGRWSAGHVVAELKPSFWEGLLANKYHAALWERGLAEAFPHYSGRRSALRERMERLRLLRNRAAHHEPIFARDLTVDHRYMCDLAGFVEPELRLWVESHSRLPSVVAGRVATVGGERPTRL